MKEVDSFVKKNTVERFGPVRQVRPELVFEIAFEGIGSSSRHKSGVAVRFPRIARWRRDKKPEDANSLDDLKAMIRP
jgi:DNA ligase-1